MVSRIATVGSCLAMVALAGGCPQTTVTPTDNGVDARIGISATRGPAPLTVNVTAVDSSSRFGDTVTYAWDFAGQSTSDEITAVHTFAEAGRHTITLRVRDSAGNEGVSTVDVRAAGGTALALIQTDVDSGPAPLLVRFDGSASTAAGDEILDYFWDFGDGGTSRLPAPLHVFEFSGEFVVRLRVVSGGGVEASTQTTIEVGSDRASLQFAGSQLATLPITGEESYPACTFESWFKADAVGGMLARIGGDAMTIDIDPVENRIRVTTGQQTIDTPAAELAGIWHHLAVSYDAAVGIAVYLDGTEIAGGDGNGELALSGVWIGPSYTGKAAEVRLWSIARGAADISASYRSRLTGSEEGLLGNWMLAEGGGQVLGNKASIINSGSLGSSTAEEASDPAWSADGPPLP